MWALTVEAMAKKPWANRRPKNVPEGKLFDLLEAKGYFVAKRGWPDFSVWDENGKLIAVVEVKPHAEQKLKTHQFAMLTALAEFGVPCFRWSPGGGFVRIGSRPDNGRRAEQCIDIRPERETVRDQVN